MDLYKILIPRDCQNQKTFVVFGRQSAHMHAEYNAHNIRVYLSRDTVHQSRRVHDNIFMTRL